MSEISSPPTGIERAASRAATPLLMLDDSATDRAIIKRLLESDPQRDYALNEFESIEDALDSLRTHTPDCVLLDYSLGDGTGLDFLHALRDQLGIRDVPVIMLTGSGSEEVAAAAFRAGATDYLAKGTLTADGLQRAISSALYKLQTDRILEMQKRELERLYAEAQQANSMKDRFLATLSHELRTPLTPILTAVTAANPRDLEPKEIEELFGTVRRNILLEARLIDDLLDLTRITNGKLLLDKQPCDAHDVLRHAVETVGDEIHRKQQRLSLHLDSPRSTVAADSARLEQIFWNLLKNAVKFTPPSGFITVSTRIVKENGELLEIVVRDTGIGIPPDMMPNIFRAFEQGADVPRRFGGLGLGLAIASAVVSAHDGTLRAESAGHNQGAAFFVHIPLAPVDCFQSNGSNAEHTYPTEGSNGVSRKLSGHVLLVEDHLDSANVLTRFLKRSGLSVSVAHTVEEATKIFGRENVDLVVSDIGLPDGTGVELMTRLSAIRRVPGIALSGYGSEGDLARSRDAGFVEHITKPVEWPRLAEAIARIIGRGAFH